MEKPIYRIPDFCEYYAISHSTFYREVAAGRLRIIKCGRSTLISRQAAQRWFKNLPLYGLTKEQVCCHSNIKRPRRKKTCSFGGYFNFFVRKAK